MRKSSFRSKEECRRGNVAGSSRGRRTCHLDQLILLRNLHCSRFLLTSSRLAQELRPDSDLRDSASVIEIDAHQIPTLAKLRKKSDSLVAPSILFHYHFALQTLAQTVANPLSNTHNHLATLHTWPFPLQSLINISNSRTSHASSTTQE